GKPRLLGDGMVHRDAPETGLHLSPTEGEPGGDRPTPATPVHPHQGRWNSPSALCAVARRACPLPAGPLRRDDEGAVGTPARHEPLAEHHDSSMLAKRCACMQTD